MRYVVKEKATGEELGTALANHSMTDEEICDIAGVKLMVTEEDHMAGDGYSLEDLEIVERD